MIFQSYSLEIYMTTLFKYLYLFLACVQIHSVLTYAAIPDSETSEFDPWTNEYGHGHTVDLGFSGITTFAHLPHHKCLDQPGSALDIAIFGIPFDSAVTYRPGTYERTMLMWSLL